VPTTLRKTEQIREVLVEACARHEMLILVTPYLRFESTFVAVDKGEFLVLATMSREDAVYGLRTEELTIRFPHGLGFFEASVAVKGLGVHGPKRVIRLSIPKTLTENDQRVAYRVERVGRITVTFSTPRPDLFMASLSDISVSGARLHAQQDIPADRLALGDEIAVSIPLVDGLYINGHARVRHMQGRSFGVEFHPPLPKDLLEPLSRWVFQRREEERERLARRLELGMNADRPSGQALPPRGVLLVSLREDLEAELRDGVPFTHPLYRIPPQVQALKEALRSQPALVLLHVPGIGLEERRRNKVLAELVGGKAPLMLVGTDVDGAALFELSTEWRASSALVWGPHRSAFFQRLVQGMIRRHHEGGDSPMAPQEPGLA